MFEINKEKASYTHPVTVFKPIDDGKYSKGTFKAVFAYLEQDEIDQVLENARQGRDNADLCAAAWIGWKDDLVDSNKTPFPYSEENKAALLQIPYIRAAVIDAFVNSIRGDGARRKN